MESIKDQRAPQGNDKTGDAGNNIVVPADRLYEMIGSVIGRATDSKNTAYGDSIHRSGAVLRILYPHGIATEQYDDAQAVVRIIDKLFRIATKKAAFGENPFRDIAGYGILKSIESFRTRKPEIPKKDEPRPAETEEPRRAAAGSQAGLVPDPQIEGEVLTQK